MPLVLAFVDYEKAFDSVEINGTLLALQQQGVADEYAALLQEINSGCTTNITQFDRPLYIPIARGVKQGDPISPKLFTACLGHIFRQLDWDNKGISVSGPAICVSSTTSSSSASQWQTCSCDSTSSTRRST